MQSTYSLVDVLDDVVVERLEALRRQIAFLLHVVHLEVDETAVGEDAEPLLPTAEQSFRLLPQRANFRDAAEVVAEHFVSKACIAFEDFLLEALVAHQELLLVQGHRAHHSIEQCVIGTDIVIINRLSLPEFVEGRQGSQIVVDASFLFLLSLVRLTVSLLLQSLLDLKFDEQGLSGGCGDHLGSVLRMLALLLLKLLSVV